MEDSPVEINDSEPVGRRSARKSTPSAKKLEAIVTASEVKALRTPAEKKIISGKILRTFRTLDEPEPEIDRNISCYEQKLTVMAKYMFGNNSVKAFTKGVKDAEGNFIIFPNEIRKVWELTDETIQCNNIIGKWNLGTDCWICGYTTVKSKSAKRQKRDSIGGAKRKREPSEDSSTKENPTGIEPTCDHVLPVAQARFFLDLYNPSIKPISPESQAVLKLEYEWAHRYCNEVKGDTPYIKNIGTDEEPVWEPDTDAMTEDLNRIYSGLRNPLYYSRYNEGKAVLLEKIGSSKIAKNRWLQERQPIMKKRMQAIADHVNKKEKGIGRLIVLAGTANCMNPKNIRSTMIEIMKSFQAEIGPVPDPEVIPIDDKKAPYEEEFEDAEKDAIKGLIQLRSFEEEEEEEEEEPVSTIADALWFLKTTKAEDPPANQWSFLFSSLSESPTKGGKTRRNIRTKK